MTDKQAEAALIAEGRALTDEITRAQDKIESLAARRAEVIKRLAGEYGRTNRGIGALLGVSGVAVNHALHRGEPKSGQLIQPAAPDTWAAVYDPATGEYAGDDVTDPDTLQELREPC